MRSEPHVQMKVLPNINEEGMVELPIRPLKSIYLSTRIVPFSLHLGLGHFTITQ